MQLTPQKAARIIRAHGIEAYANGVYVEAIPVASKDGKLVECEPVLVEPTVEAVRAFLGY